MSPPLHTELWLLPVGETCPGLQGARAPGPAPEKQGLENVLSAWAMLMDLGIWIWAPQQ